jgi:hypothetical protein
MGLQQRPGTPGQVNSAGEAKHVLVTCY